MSINVYVLIVICIIVLIYNSDLFYYYSNNRGINNIERNNIEKNNSEKSNLEKKAGSNENPVYFNMNLQDRCNCAEGEIDEENKKQIEKIKKEHEKELQKCNEKFKKEKERGDELYLKYANPYHMDIDNIIYNKDHHPIVDGDDKLTYKMIDMSLNNKRAMTNRAMWNKYSFLPYYEQELQNHANSIWWENDDLEHDF